MQRLYLRRLGDRPQNRLAKWLQLAENKRNSGIRHSAERMTRTKSKYFLRKKQK